jgi:hypothetical protein
MFKKLTEEDKNTIKIITFSMMVGLGIGVLSMIPFIKAGLILKDATWTPQGDMILTFFNRRDGILIPRPGS